MSGYDAQWEAFLRGLTMERFRHVPEAGVPVDGPQAQWIEDQKRVALETAEVVVVMPRLDLDLSGLLRDVNEDRRHA